MSTYGQYYANAPYGSPAWHEQQARLRNAHKAPDPILAQQQIAAAQPPALSVANPLPTTAIPPGTQVNPRQGGTPGQRFVNGAKGILGHMTSGGEGPSQYISEQYGQQSPVEAATHTMPDGTVMSGATHADAVSGPGILARPQPERYVPAPVVDSVGQGPMTEEERAAFAQTPAGQRLLAAQQESELPAMGDLGPQTGHRRDTTALAAAKKNRHVSLAEALGRYGSGILNAKGGRAAVGSLGTTTADIANIEREQENLRLQEQAKQQEAYQKSIAEQQEKSSEFDEIIGEYDTAIAQMDTLYGDVAAGGGSLTGPISGTLGAWWDTLQGNPEAYTRLAMDQFKVDEILKNVAKTKGAISDREMATFERPMPSMMADEKVWLDWIYEKRAAAVSVRNKLRAMQGGGGPSNYSPEDQALIDQYSK